MNARQVEEVRTDLLLQLYHSIERRCSERRILMLPGTFSADAEFLMLSVPAGDDCTTRGIKSQLPTILSEGWVSMFHRGPSIHHWASRAWRETLSRTPGVHGERVSHGLAAALQAMLPYAARIVRQLRLSSFPSPHEVRRDRVIPRDDVSEPDEPARLLQALVRAFALHRMRDGRRAWAVVFHRESEEQPVEASWICDDSIESQPLYPLLVETLHDGITDDLLRQRHRLVDEQRQRTAELVRSLRRIHAPVARAWRKATRGDCSTLELGSCTHRGTPTWIGLSVVSQDLSVDRLAAVKLHFVQAVPGAWLEEPFRAHGEVIYTPPSLAMSEIYVRAGAREATPVPPRVVLPPGGVDAWVHPYVGDLSEDSRPVHAPAATFTLSRMLGSPHPVACALWPFLRARSQGWGHRTICLNHIDGEVTRIWNSTRTRGAHGDILGTMTDITSLLRRALRQGHERNTQTPRAGWDEVPCHLDGVVLPREVWPEVRTQDGRTYDEEAERARTATHHRRCTEHRMRNRTLREEIARHAEEQHRRAGSADRDPDRYARVAALIESLRQSNESPDEEEQLDPF